MKNKKPKINKQKIIKTLEENHKKLIRIENNFKFFALETLVILIAIILALDMFELSLISKISLGLFIFLFLFYTIIVMRIRKILKEYRHVRSEINLIRIKLKENK